MFIEETKGGGMSGVWIGKVPIEVEYFSRPTSTFSYLGGVLDMKGTLLVHVLELKKESWSIVTAFP